MVNIYLHTKHPIGKIFDPPQDLIVESMIKRETTESDNIGKKHAVAFPSYFEPNSTGSWSNCTEQSTPKSKKSSSSHPDEKITVVSCHTIYYRTKKSSFRKAKDVIIGVLSKGPERRNVIRDTWAKDQKGIFFLVAGPWNVIAEEYETYGDIIWIDEEEIYQGEKSVLTYKTQSFIKIIYDMSTELHLKIYYYI